MESLGTAGSTTIKLFPVCCELDGNNNKSDNKNNSDNNHTSDNKHKSQNNNNNNKNGNKIKGNASIEKHFFFKWAGLQ